MTELPPIALDPRFLAAVEAFNAGEFFDASEGFEDLFFEAVRDEVPFARALLQLAVGCLHAERGQRRAAAERLAEALIAIDVIVDDRGFDMRLLRDEITALIDATRRGVQRSWPQIRRTGE